MIFLIADTDPTHSIFEQAVREGGKPTAYAVVAVMLTIILVRGALLPLLHGFEESRKTRRAASETTEAARHAREMELEHVRLERDKASALSSVAMKDSLDAAEKIHEMAASVVAVLNQMLQSLLRERGRRSRDAEERSQAHDV